MPLIEWSDEYSVGLEMFDAEHKKLIAIINGLHDSFEHGVDRSIAIKALDELIDYTIEHFAHEDSFFDSWAYPDKAAHRVAHQELRQQVLEYRASMVAKGGIEMALELITFLRYWLLGHIMSEDKRFCAYLSGKGFSGSLEQSAPQA
jgi:hemerythrin-like metal-binding protein